MEYRIRDAEGKKGVVSNTHGFFSTYLDGSFREKWNGYWSPSYKYLDYFAVKVNGIWLDDETLQETHYGEKVVYHHKASSLEIRQEISCPEEIPGFKVSWKVKNQSDSQKAVKASIEAGVDIRPRTEDLGGKNYTVETSNAGMKIIKDDRDRYLTITGEKFEFDEDSYIKEHYPGEQQICIVPGDISCRCELEPGKTKTAELVFMTDGEPGREIKGSESSLRHEELGRTFNYCIDSMENLIYDRNGLGVIAGHPWFQNYWSRDTFGTIYGMIDAGLFRESREILANFAEREPFPSKINTNGGTETEYPRCDSIPLFALAVEKLERYAEADDELLERAEELLEENRPEGEIVEHDPSGTWMDTLERENAVELQSEWIAALEAFGKDNEKLMKGLKRFEDGDYLKDNLGNDFESINPAIPLMLGQIEDEKAEKYLEKINGEFSSRYGARTRSVTDPGYESDGYHTGSVWGLTTTWAAAANLEYGNVSHGKNFLKKMTQFIDRNQLGALPEVVNAESGESIGCDEQAWSAGLYVFVIDTYLLGIDVREDRVIIDPVEGVNAERKNKRIRGEELDIKVEDGEAEIINDPDLEIEVR
ncbi:MAG: amylo-alpha-1,6-glucosidase [Candidatus Nanohalobium sp.]